MATPSTQIIRPIIVIVHMPTLKKNNRRTQSLKYLYDTSKEVKLIVIDNRNSITFNHTRKKDREITVQLYFLKLLAVFQNQNTTLIAVNLQSIDTLDMRS